MGSVASNVFATETSNRLTENNASQKPPKVTIAAAEAKRHFRSPHLSGSSQHLTCFLATATTSMPPKPAAIRKKVACKAGIV